MAAKDTAEVDGGGGSMGVNLQRFGEGREEAGDRGLDELGQLFGGGL